MKRKHLKNSLSTQFMQVPVTTGGLTNSSSSGKLGFGQGYKSSSKSFADSYYSHRTSSIGETRKKKNLGITLSKIELPDRLVQQKELFNEMGGWLSQTFKQRDIILSQQNSTKNSTNKKFLSTTNYFNPNISHTSSFIFPDSNQQEKKKPIFYEHKNIFRVKDFKPLKNREDKIAKSIDDPISISQRRLLIQEFEMKVQQFLKILKIKKELGSKAYEKFYKTVEQSMGGLSNFNFNIRGSSSASMHQINAQQTSFNQPSWHQTSFHQGNSTQNSQPYLNYGAQFQNAFISATQSQTLTNQTSQNKSLNMGNQKQNGLNGNKTQYHGISSLAVDSTEAQKQNNNAMYYPSKLDSVISPIPKQRRSSGLNLQNQSIQNVGQGDLNSSNTSDLMQQQYQYSTSKHTSFIDRTKDIEWQYNTYYQINQHQFQELSEKQLSYLTSEEKEQYYIVLNYFKQVGHRFQVQVIVQSSTEGSDVYQQTHDDNGNTLPINDSKSKKQYTQTSHSSSRLALHQRLQDYILDRCKNYLNSDGTDYDEKLKMMKKQYEQMLDNFEKKSHKVWLPPNIRPRNQDFNDYYIYDDSANQIKKYQKQIFYDVTEENFASILSLNLDLIKDEQNEQIEEEKVQIDEEVGDQADEDDEEEEDEDEESEYDETPYSQKKARNKRKLIRPPKVDSPVYYRPPKQPEQKKKKKKAEQVVAENSPQYITPSARSDYSDDSELNFSRSVNNARHYSQQVNRVTPVDSPQVRQKHAQSVFNKVVNSPTSSKAAESEEEDKVDDKQDAGQKKNNQGRSQFSKKAQPTSGNPSRNLIEISDLKTDRSRKSNPDKENEQQQEQDADPKSLKSIEALSLTPPSKPRKKKQQKDSNESLDGFEYAKDELEDLVEPQQKNRQSSTEQKRKQDVDPLSDTSINQGKNTDRDSTSIRKILDTGGSISDSQQPDSKRKDNNQKGKRDNSQTKQRDKSQTKQRDNSQTKQNDSVLSREKSGSNVQIKSNQQIQNPQGQNKGGNNNAASSFKQKIVNEIKMEEEQKNKVNEIEMEIITLGTGLFDRMLSCNNYLDFEFKVYFKEQKNIPINPNVQHKTENDRKIYTKLSQWEYEVSDENENYVTTLENIETSLLDVQQQIIDSKDKNMKPNNKQNKNKKPTSSQKITPQQSNSSQKIPDQSSSRDILNDFNSRKDSIIEADTKIQSSIQIGLTSFIQNRDISPSIGSQFQRVQSQSIQTNNLNSQIASPVQSISNTPSNTSQQEIQIPANSNKNKGLHINLSKLNQQNTQNSYQEPQQYIKNQKFATNQTNSSERDKYGERQKSITSDSQESQSVSSKNSLENVDNIKIPRSISSVSDCSAFSSKK